MEDVVVDMVDNSEQTPGAETSASPSPSPSHKVRGDIESASALTSSPNLDSPNESDGTLAASTRLELTDDSAGKEKGKNKPTLAELTPLQFKMIAWLNSLPQLKKERAFIENIRNSHGTIIARDVKNFEFHKVGQGVLRHWAEHFVP